MPYDESKIFREELGNPLNRIVSGPWIVAHDVTFLPCVDALEIKNMMRAWVNLENDFTG